MLESAPIRGHGARVESDASERHAESINLCRRNQLFSVFSDRGLWPFSKQLCCKNPHHDQAWGQAPVSGATVGGKVALIAY